MTISQDNSSKVASQSGVAMQSGSSANVGPNIIELSAVVREHFGGAVDLSTALAGVMALTMEQRKRIVQQALIFIEENYAHLPLKRAMHSIDPVQRLKLLLQTLESASAETMQPEMEFHRELTEIFTSLRDLHTNYLLPAPFSKMTAFLPFMVEDYFDGGTRRYLVSHIVQGFSHPTFVSGVEVVYWNGMPIHRAVMNNAYRYSGSNREARIARGVQTLTARALRIAPAPDEEWVVVGYLNASGALEELRFNWMVDSPPASAIGAEAEVHNSVAASLGLDLEQDTIQRMRKALFAPQVVMAEKEAAKKTVSGARLGDLETSLPQVFEARTVTTSVGVFGYIRIRTFSIDSPQQFVTEFIRLITALPPNGLIIDVRGNGGGVINAGEYILQTLTPRRIEPEPLQFINTALNLEICRRNGPDSQWTDLSPWVESMSHALQTGAAFSAGFPISDPAQCNAIGQKYFGPVVLITDALCYSTTDIFAAGFQDHEIGPVLGVDGNTGAGGANVWEHKYFVSNVLPGPNSVYKPLPNGAGMRVSIRRTLRVGRRSGTPVEDLGVTPDQRHFMTRDDLLRGNVDLINKAGALLAGISPVRNFALKLTAEPSAKVKMYMADTQGITRLDIYLDDRPLQSVDVEGQHTQFAVTKPSTGQHNLEILAFDGTQLVVRYKEVVK